MVQSPSWAANWFAASPEITRISRNPNVHYRTHKRSPPVSILDQPNQVHIPHPTSLTPILILHTNLRLGLTSVLFSSDFPTKTLYTPYTPLLINDNIYGLISNRPWIKYIISMKGTGCLNMYIIVCVCVCVCVCVWLIRVTNLIADAKRSDITQWSCILYCVTICRLLRLISTVSGTTALNDGTPGNWFTYILINLKYPWFFYFKLYQRTEIWNVVEIAVYVITSIFLHINSSLHQVSTWSVTHRPKTWNKVKCRLYATK